MTIYLITRHPGAAQWLRKRVDPQGHRQDIQVLTHVEDLALQPSDHMVGVLPIHLIARAGLAGARSWCLSVEVPEPLRGRELSCAQLDLYGARIQEVILTMGPLWPGGGVEGAVEPCPATAR